MKTRWLCGLILLTLFSPSGQTSDEFMLFDAEDKEMNHAIEIARQNVDVFLKLVNRRPAHISGYSAYLKFEDEGKTEFLWLTGVKPHKDFYIGVIVSKPRLVTHVEQGDTIGFHRSDIYDWEYFDEEGQKTHGARTTCVMLDLDNDEDISYMRARKLECDL